MGFFDNLKKKKGKKMPVPPKPKNAQVFTTSPKMPLPKPPVQKPVQEVRPAKPWPKPTLPSAPKPKEVKQDIPSISPWPEQEMQQQKYEPVKEKVNKDDVVPDWPEEDIKDIKEKQEIPDELPDLPIPDPDFLKAKETPDLPEFPEPEIMDAEKILETFPLPEFEKKQKALFVRTDNYKQILTNLDTIKNYVQEGPNTIYMLKNLKRNADIEHKEYLTTLEDIQRKLMYVENVLSQATRY